MERAQVSPRMVANWTENMRPLAESSARRCSAITQEQIAAYQNARIWRGSTLR